MGYNGNGASAGTAMQNQYLGPKQAALGDPVESPTRIRNAICNIEDTVEGLSQAIAVLEKRFDVVLTPPSPSVATGNAPAPAMISSDVNQRLEQILNRLQNLGSWVRVLTDRAEV